MKKIFLSILCALLCMSTAFTQRAFAIGVADSIDYGSFIIKAEKQIWHFDDGHWEEEEPDGSIIRVTDAEMTCAMNIGDSLEEEYFMFEIPATDALLADAEDGTHLRAYYTDANHSYFVEEDGFLKYQDHTLYYVVPPRFNEFTLTFDDFVKGMECQLPVLDYKTGNNIYNVYLLTSGKYSLKGNVVGYYDAKDAFNTVKAGFLHPKSITSNTGAISTKNKLSFDGGANTTPKNCYVGNGNFKNGGSVGLSFSYSFTIHVYGDFKTEEPETPQQTTIYYYHRRK